MRPADMRRHGEWVLLGEDEPHEIAFGTIGKFWAGETRWLTIDADHFTSFAEPGLGEDRLQLLAQTVRRDPQPGEL